MDLATYQSLTGQFAVYPKELEREYLAAGLVAEVGELFGVEAKGYRGDAIDTLKMRDELGDVCWMLSQLANRYRSELTLHNLPTPPDSLTSQLMYAAVDVYYEICINRMGARVASFLNTGVSLVAEIATLHGYTLDDVLQANIDKLTDRRERGVIRGSGDER